MSLSGWCQSAPGARPDQHHKFCRSVTCSCAAHGENPAQNKGKSGSMAPSKQTGRTGALTPNVRPSPTDKESTDG